MDATLPPALGALLAHADLRVRQAAQFELAARGTKGMPIFINTAKANPSQLARLHAIDPASVTVPLRFSPGR